MGVTVEFNADAEAFLEEGLGLFEAAEVDVERGEIVQRSKGSLIRGGLFFPEGERLFVAALGLEGVVEVLVKRAEVVEHDGPRGGFCSLVEGGLENLNGFFV